LALGGVIRDTDGWLALAVGGERRAWSGEMYEKREILTV